MKKEQFRTLAWTCLTSAILLGFCGSYGKAASIEVYVLKPVTDAKVLPDTDPRDLPGNLSGSMTVYVAPGEYEPASFVVRSAEDIKSLRVKVSDLAGPDDRIIPAANVDIKVVKCWYQADGAWKTESRLSDRKVLVPELLLNDVALVKVDTDQQANHLRLTYPSGDKFICITEKPATQDRRNPANKDIYEVAPGYGPAGKLDFLVKDSPVLLPVDVAGGKNQQFWITVGVPDDAVAGFYRGVITLSDPSSALGSLSLKVRVLPFKLSEPRTYYDVSKKYTSSIYFRGELNLKGSPSVFGALGDDGVIHDFKTPEQFGAELRNMYRHGVTSPALSVPYGLINTNEILFREILRLRKEAGITGPYYMVFDLVMNQQDEAGLEEVRRNVRRLMSIAGEYGISEFYFYGLDESAGKRLRSQRPAWEAAREAGGKMMVSGFEGTFKAMGDILDLFVWNGAPSQSEADKWHSVGHSIWCYSAPQAGVENPLVYRRNYGLSLWKSKYDGAATYCYQTENGSWNDFNDIARDLSFTYPTSDGVVDTIAWEGYREAIDDIRYATTLKLAIDEASRSNDAEKKKVADEATAYLDNVNTNDDLDEIRLRIIGYIIRLGPESRSDGLVAHWKFDENGQDSSGNDNEGVVTGAHWTKGVSGSALEFDGRSTYIDYGNDPVLNLSQAISIEAWMNWRGGYSGPETEFGGILKERQYILYGTIRETAPNLQFYIKVWDEERKRFEPGAGTDYLYDTDTWYHVVGTYDGNTLRIYVNGKPAGEEDKLCMPSGQESLTIGRAFGIPFRGAMDEVKIYNRALSEEEIVRHYSSARQGG